MCLTIPPTLGDFISATLYVILHTYVIGGSSSVYASEGIGVALTLRSLRLRHLSPQVFLEENSKNLESAVNVRHYQRSQIDYLLISSIE